MFRAFLWFTLAALPLLLFVAYCRSLLVQASQIELSAAVLKAIALEFGSISAEDFYRLKTLVGLCPLGQKDRVPLVAASSYFSLLTLLYAVFSRICGVIANWTERERQRCSYFVAVRLDQRIATARRLWAEQMVHSEEQRNTSTRSS